MYTTEAVTSDWASVAAKHGFNVVSVRITHESAIVGGTVLGTRAGCPVVLPARLDGGVIEPLHCFR